MKVQGKVFAATGGKPGHFKRLRSISGNQGEVRADLFLKSKTRRRGDSKNVRSIV